MARRMDQKEELFWIMVDVVAYYVHMYRPLGFERTSGVEINIHNLIHHRIFVNMLLIGATVMSLLFAVSRLDV